MNPTPNLRRIAVIALAGFLAACQDAPPVAPPAQTAVGPGVGQDRVAGWFRQASPAVLALGGTVFADHDEVNNRLVFGVERAAAIPGVERALARLGVPGSAYTVRVTAPIHQVATLRSRFRPTRGGTQIHFSQFLCTLGFNVTFNGGRSFITNSHCTNTQGGTEGTKYFQPTSFVDPTVIATEARDPQYFTGGVCPVGRKCRFSDASRAAYSSTVSSTRGAIAKTTGANTGSLTIGGTFAVTAQDNLTTRFSIGTVVNKVGRTTGWTRGRVANTCVDTNVSGTNITQLCQTFVSAGVGAGDSGSPVFRVTSGDNVTLVGILWGGSSDGKLFVFSPLKQIQQELGSVTATK